MSGSGDLAGTSSALDAVSETRVAARIAYVAYRSAGALAQVLPRRLAVTLSRRVGRTLRLAMPGRRRMVARHLRRVKGPELSGRELSRAVRAVFDSYARYWLEAFRLPRETPETIEAGMRVEGLEHLEAATAGGAGVVLAAPHLGGWDFGGAWLARHGFRPLAVAERLEPPELFDWFVSWRERLGIAIVPVGPEAGTRVLEAVKDGQAVTLISDRDILGSGVEVEFFGETTSLPGGPATLALRTGVAVLPVAVYFEGDTGHLGVVRPALEVERRGRFREDVVRVTRDLARELEALIRRAPEQWHLMQPNWPSDPGYREHQAAARGERGAGS